MSRNAVAQLSNAMHSAYSEGMAKAKTDRRIERTRYTLLDAFVALYFERDYETITVADIAKRANIGRSTFYEHFRGKDALLAVSHRQPFSLLAAVVDADAKVESLRSLLDHFWGNRGRTPAARNLALRRALGRSLAALVFERLRERAKAAPARVSTERLRWGSIAIAEMLLGSIALWLNGEMAATPAALAEMLHAQAQAAAVAACTI